MHIYTGENLLNLSHMWIMFDNAKSDVEGQNDA